MARKRANRRNYGFDETKFRPGQRKAAIALVEYEFANRSERKTKAQIADEVGVSRVTLHTWDTQDSNFIAYKNYLAATYLDSHLAHVYRKLLEGIDKGSMKGIEMFLKRQGELDRKSEVTVRQESTEDQSFDERKAALLDRLNDDEDDSGNEGEDDSE